MTSGFHLAVNDICLFWNFTQHRIVVLLMFWGNPSVPPSRIKRSLKKGPTGYPETSVTTIPHCDSPKRVQNPFKTPLNGTIYAYPVTFRWQPITHCCNVSLFCSFFDAKNQ
jgi:hypothetical protein